MQTRIDNTTARRQPRGSPRRGVTLVESAIVLGIFLFMLLGMLDLGLAVLRQNSLDAAARSVAREAVVRGARAADGEAWGPQRFASRSSDSSEIAATARESLVTIDPQAARVIVDWPDGGNQPEQRVNVRLRYKHKFMFPVLYGRHLDLRSECVMRIAH